MNDKEIKKLLVKQAIQKSKKRKQKEKIKILYSLFSDGLIKKPKGIFIKKCPECNQKLLKKKYCEFSFGVEISFIHYICPNCDYECVI